MAILAPKPGPRQDFKEEKETKREDSKNINALPDFEIRTMKDDLAGLGVKRGDKNLLMREVVKPKATPGASAPAVPRPTTATAETEKITEKEIKEEIQRASKSETKEKESGKTESGLIVPENLPVIQGPKKSILPSTEELISRPKESPFAPLPPKESETFFITEEEPEEQRFKETEEIPELQQMEKVKIPEPAYAPEKEKIRKILKFSVVGVIALAIIGAGAFIYLKTRPPEPEPEPPVKIEPQLSAPLINFEEKKILSLVEGQGLFQLLRNEAKTEQQIQTLKRLGVLKNETEFLSLIEVLQRLEILASPYILSELKDNYNLIIFNQEAGKRLGIIIEINNPENLKSQIRAWETTMLDDFKNFYPVQLPGQAASKTFLDDNYKNVIIRYKNLPYPILTLNYTILGNFLVIGTSKEMIYTTIDRILAK